MGYPSAAARIKPVMASGASWAGAARLCNLAPPAMSGRKSYRFVRSGRGAKSAAVIYTLMQTAKLNNVAPQAWLLQNHITGA